MNSYFLLTQYAVKKVNSEPMMLCYQDITGRSVGGSIDFVVAPSVGDLAEEERSGKLDELCWGR